MIVSHLLQEHIHPPGEGSRPHRFPLIWGGEVMALTQNKPQFSI